MYLLGLLTAAALGLGVAACGGASTNATSRGPTRATAIGASAPATSNPSAVNDRDNDGDHNDDDEGVLNYGHAADAADRGASESLVRRYFAAAAAADGGRACSLLAPFVEQSVVEDEGRSPALRGNSCAAVMTKLFRRQRRLLAEKNATLRVIGVRVEEDKALAILEFPAIPEVRQLAERRVEGTWRVLDLLDGILE
jgi:ketosteroid isomerase-like protein